MSDTTKPVFIVGSGRSGTRSLGLMLSGISGVESHHEYLCTHIQPVAAKYYMGIIDKIACKKAIMSIHGSAMYYSQARVWIDASNKLSWIIKPLHELYPNAKFIHVVRDGRKVVSSFYHKLAPEMYDDTSVRLLSEWIRNPKKYPEPPPEKKYWWNIPQKGQRWYREFPTFSQFERICYHWVEALRVIEESFRQLPASQTLEVRLEDLVSQKNTLKKFFDFLDIPYEASYHDYLQKPRNVFFPMDFDLTEEQLQKFTSFSNETMKRFGYTSKKIQKMRY